MPLYEYICRDCHTDFEALTPTTRRDSGDIPCPRCGAARTARKVSLTAPAVVKSSGTSAPGFDCGASGGCCGGGCALD